MCNLQLVLRFAGLDPAQAQGRRRKRFVSSSFERHARGTHEERRGLTRFAEESPCLLKLMSCLCNPLTSWSTSSMSARPTISSTVRKPISAGQGRAGRGGTAGFYHNGQGQQVRASMQANTKTQLVQGGRTPALSKVLAPAAMLCCMSLHRTAKKDDKL